MTCYENIKICNLPGLRRVRRGGQFSIANFPLEKKLLPFDRTKKNMGRRGIKFQAPDRHRTNFQTGFTLLELIIAFALLSIVTLIIGSGFSLGRKAWEKGENVTQETQRIRILRDMIFREIKSAYPYKMKIEGKKVIIFKGKNDSIMFVTAFVNPLAGGFKWVRYSHDNENLMFKEGILPDKNLLDKISGNEEIIDTDLADIKFMYLSLDKDEWEESWDFGEKLPAAVKVKIASLQPFIIRLPNISELSDMEGDMEDWYLDN